MTIQRAERIVLVSGLLLLGSWAAARLHRFIGSQLAVTKLQAEMDARSEGIAGDLIGPNRDLETSADFRLWSIQRVRAYRESMVKDPDAAVAVLKIPAIGLAAPLFDGTDDVTLNRGLGRISGTARVGQFGNIGIAGHRDGFFRGLKDIRLGNAVELSRPGFSDEYVISRIQIVDPGDVHVLDPSTSPALTLVTCFPFYFVGDAPRRFVVTASMTRSVRRLRTGSRIPNP